MTRVIMLCAMAAVAACAAEQPASDYAAAAAQLDQARAEIAPPLGATTYTLDHRRLLDQPGDENRTLAQSLEQLPGVTRAPNGQVRVRGQQRCAGALGFSEPASLRCIATDTGDAISDAAIVAAAGTAAEATAVRCANFGIVKSWFPVTGNPDSAPCGGEQ